MTYPKPLPARSPLNAPYGDGLKRHELRLQRCQDCGTIWFPPAPFCPGCWSRQVLWQTLSGRGTVNAWVVFHQAYFASFTADVPYNVAEVELDAGPRLLTNLVAVEIVFDDVTDEVTLAKFRPRRHTCDS